MILFNDAPGWISARLTMRKRNDFRIAFDQYDPEEVARYEEAKIRDLLSPLLSTSLLYENGNDGEKRVETYL